MDEELRPMDGENEDNGLIELVDEDGNSETFELLASFDMDGKPYLAVADTEEEEEDPESVEVLFLRIEEDEDGNDVYVPVDDDAEADAAFASFMELVDAEEDEE